MTSSIEIISSVCVILTSRSGDAVLSIAALGSLPVLSALVVGGLGSIVFLRGWVRLLRDDFINAFAVFIVLLPLWLYTQVLQWPPIPVPGTKAYAATLLKQFILVTLFGYWLLVVAPSRERLLFPKLLFGYFGAVIVVKTATVTQLSAIPLGLRPYIEMFVLGAVPLLGTALSRAEIKRLLAGFLAAGGMLTAIALLNAFVDPNLLLSNSIIREGLFKGGAPNAYLGARLQSITANPNDLGQLMVLTAVVAMGFLYSSKKELREQWPLLVLLGASLLVLMLTRSRDDIGLLGIGVLLFLFIFRKKLTTVVIGGLGSLGALYNLGQIQLVFERLLTRGNPRFAKWLDVLEFFGVSIVFGGKTASQIPNIAAIDSTYVTLLVEIGAIGLAMFLIFNTRLVMGLLYDAKQHQDALSAIVGIGLTTLLGTFAFRGTLFSFPVAFYYWVFVALGLSLLYSDREPAV